MVAYVQIKHPETKDLKLFKLKDSEIENILLWYVYHNKIIGNIKKDKREEYSNLPIEGKVSYEKR